MRTLVLNAGYEPLAVVSFKRALALVMSAKATVVEVDAEHPVWSVDAVFDHLGAASVVRSWRLLAPGGTLVSYGSAATRDDTGSRQLPVLKILARTWLWNALPNRRHAFFFNVWAGRRFSPRRFRARLRDDLGQVLRALAEGSITAQVAARFPLSQAGEALRLAESGTVSGKIILTP